MMRRTSSDTLPIFAKASTSDSVSFGLLSTAVATMRLESRMSCARCSRVPFVASFRRAAMGRVETSRGSVPSSSSSLRVAFSGLLVRPAIGGVGGLLRICRRRGRRRRSRRSGQLDRQKRHAAPPAGQPAEQFLHAPPAATAKSSRQQSPRCQDPDRLRGRRGARSAPARDAAASRVRPGAVRRA